MTQSFDVIVLGAGAMGSAATYHLAKAGQRVLCLEQFEIDHRHGSSYGVSRIIRYSYDNPAYIALMKAVYPLWFALEEEAGETLYIKTGGIDFGSPDEPSLGSTHNSLRVASIPYETLSPIQASHRFSQFRFAENLVILYQADAGILAASKCVLAHLRLAQAKGAIVQAKALVTHVSCKSNSVEVQTELETYSAGNLVIAAGSWTQPLLFNLGMNLPLSIMPCQLAFFEADKPKDYEPGKLPVFMAHMNGTYGEIPYGIPAVDGSGVKVSTFYGWQTVNQPKQVDYTPKEEWVKTLRTFIRSYLPGANGSLLSSRICLYTMTPDKHFIIDQHPEYPHVVFGAGFSGHGFKFSPLIGQILADLALSGTTQHDISLFRASRFLEKTMQKAIG